MNSSKAQPVQVSWIRATPLLSAPANAPVTFSHFILDRLDDKNSLRRNNIDMILEGLPSKYESLVNLISMIPKFQPLTTDEIEGLLHPQEVRVENNKKSIKLPINLTQVSNTEHYFWFSSFSDGRSFTSRGRGRGGRGRTERFNVQCQVFLKFCTKCLHLLSQIWPKLLCSTKFYSSTV